MRISTVSMQGLATTQGPSREGYHILLGQLIRELKAVGGHFFTVTEFNTANDSERQVHACTPLIHEHFYADVVLKQDYTGGLLSSQYLLEILKDMPGREFTGFINGAESHSFIMNEYRPLWLRSGSTDRAIIGVVQKSGNFQLITKNISQPWSGKGFS